MTSPVSALSPVESFIPQSPRSPTGFAAAMPLLSSHSPSTTVTAVAAAAVLSSRRKVTPFSIENLLNSREQQERERIIELGIKEEGEDAADVDGDIHEDPSGLANDNCDGKEDENQNKKSWHQPEEAHAAEVAGQISGPPSSKPRHDLPRPTPLSVVVSPPSAAAAMNFLAAAGASGGGSGRSSALAVAMAHHISNLLPSSSSSSSVASNHSTSSPVPSPVPSPPPAAAADKAGARE